MRKDKGTYLRDFIDIIPLERLVVETDAPYLGFRLASVKFESSVITCSNQGLDFRVRDSFLYNTHTCRTYTTTPFSDMRVVLFMYS